MSKKYDRIFQEGTSRRIVGYREFLNKWRYRKKQALLSYLCSPVISHLQSSSTFRFSNEGIALAWAEVLNRLGYEVDIINWDDTDSRPANNYDLVIVHGGKNYESLVKKLEPNYKLIYFSTGSYWKFNNQAEEQRLKDFQRRHKITPKPDRYIYDSEEEVNYAASGIIALGDPSMMDTFPKDLRVITINNASYPDDHFDKAPKDYSQAKNNFLFFAGSGNIHKGLDLLIDSFKDLDQHLYIVTVPDKQVLSVFKQELSLPNIHLTGDVNMRTQEFYEIMDKCAFVVLPSCSEGQAGSVVEAMNQGLIPIVSKETRLDCRNYGAVLKSNSIACIKQTVRKFAALEPAEVEKLARLTRQTAIKDHNPDKFRKDLKQAIESILK